MTEPTSDHDHRSDASARTTPPTQRGSTGPCAPQLAQAVDHALWALADFNQPRMAPSLAGQQLENALGVGSTMIDTGPEAPTIAVAAARTACAHMYAGEVEEAHLSLLAARDALAGQRTAGGRPVP